MADRISIDTDLLKEISVDLRQTAGKMNSLASEIDSATRNVRRVASSQVQTIENLEKICQRIAFTQQRISKLSGEVSSAASKFESAERRMAGYLLGAFESPSTEVQSAGGREQNSILSGEIKNILQGIFSGEITNINIIALPTSPFGDLYRTSYEFDADWGDYKQIWWNNIKYNLIHLHPGDKFVSWASDMLDNIRVLPDGTIEIGWELESHGNLKKKESVLYGLIQRESDTGVSVQDNSMIRLTPHQFNLFGRQITLPLPYFNFSKATDLHLGNTDYKIVENNVIGYPELTASGPNASADAGIQWGFDKDGNFITNVGLGAEVNAADLSVVGNDRYISVEAGYGVGEGAGVHFSQKNLTPTLDVALPFMGNWSGRITIKGEQIISDYAAFVNTEINIGKSIMEGDLSGVEESVKNFADYFLNT